MSLIKNDPLKLTDAQLEMVEAMGGTGFKPAEIAVVLMIDEETFITEFKKKDSLIRQRYRKGFLLASLTLRKRIFKDAGFGSSPAQSLSKKILDDADYANNRLDEE